MEVVFVVLQPGRLQLDPVFDTNFSTQRILFIRGCGSYAAQQLVANSSKILDVVNVMNHAKLNKAVTCVTISTAAYCNQCGQIITNLMQNVNGLQSMLLYASYDCLADALSIPSDVPSVTCDKMR